MLNKKNRYKIIYILITTIFLLSLVSLIFETSSATGVQEVWHKQEDRGNGDRAYDVTTDSNDNVIVTGVVNGYAYTIKYDQNGTIIWQKIGFNGYSRGIIVDNNDNIIITGGSGDYHTIKYDENGNEIWNIVYDSGDIDYAYDVASDSENNVIVVGQSHNDYCIVKYNLSGTLLWNITFDSGGSEGAYGVAVDTEDNIIVTGESSGDYFTIKYDPSGNVIWNSIYDGGDLDGAWDVATDSNNNVIITGESYVNSYNKIVYTIKYSSSGNEIWSISPDTNYDCSASSVAVDAYDNIIVFGTIYAGSHLDANYYTIKYDANANEIWTTMYDSSYGDDIGRGNTVDSLNKIIVTGQVKRGPSNWDYYTIKYNEPPTANFTYEPSTITTKDTIWFNDTSFDSAGKIANWSWSFGDGDISYDQNPTHRYVDDGKYTVTLTVTDDDGVTDITTKQITVKNVPPVTNFTYSPSSPNDLDTISFTDNSADSDGTIAEWLWDFGDGNTSTLQNPTHNYADNGTYTVNLTTWDDDDASNSSVKLITVLNIPPLADFAYSPLSPTDMDIIHFTDNSADSDGTIAEWLWDFDDGDISYDQNPSHKYSDNGTYIVTLTVQDNDGDTNTTSKSILVNNVPPVADFTYSSGELSTANPIQFVDQSTDPDGFVANWTWDFDDGDISYDQNPSHKYSDNGTYTVALTIRDNDGGSDVAFKDIIVADGIPPEIIDNTPNVSYTGNPFIFNATIIDDVQVDAVWVEYWFGTVPSINESMNNIGGDYWEKEITIQSDSTDTLHYIISASDISNNWNNSGTQDVTIIDDDPPEITNVDAFPNPQEYDGYVNITCHVEDNIEIDTVKVDITGPDGFTHVNTTMLQRCYYNAIYNILGTYTFFIWANDTSGNTCISSIYTFSIQDTTHPVIIDNTGDTAFTGNPFLFNALIVDNMDVARVYIEYWYGNNPQHTITDMVNTAGDYYEHNIVIENTLEVLHYEIFVNDTSNNWNNTGIVHVIVYDNILPKITDVNIHPPSQKVGRYVNITCNVTDNIGVSTVKVNINGPDGFTPVNTSMNKADNGYFYNNSYSIAGDYSFFIWVKDQSDNKNVSSLHNFNVYSNDAPNVPSNPSPAQNEPDVGVDADLSWTGGDPDVMDTVTYDVYFGTNNPPSKVINNQSGTTYDPGKMKYLTTYYWQIVAWDNHSASTDGSIWSFTTVPNSQPVVYNIPDQTINEGKSFTNVGLDNYVSDFEDLVENITWTYSGNIELTVVINTTTRIATIAPPNENWNGNETITFTATDTGGFSDSDNATFTVTPVNDAPVVSDIPSQTIAEGETFAKIKLDDYVEDVDDPDENINWSYSGNTELIVSIADRVATIKTPDDPEWSGNETITFTATDTGGLSDLDNATFTVTSVNDPPKVKIVKPKKEIYINNEKKLARLLGIPLIIGDITIEVNATDVDSNIEKVEFYINGQLKNITSKPNNDGLYSYTWIKDRKTFIHLFIIKIVAYDNEEKPATATVKMSVRKYL